MALPRRGPREGEAGFSLVELMVAFMMLAVVMAALAPAFYGTLRAAAVSDQRSQATQLAVEATEQMRSMPYGEVGYQTVPAYCTGQDPVILARPGRLDSLPATVAEGPVSYSVERCVYWVDSSIPGDTEAYKQTQVTVSWAGQAGPASVSQTSALYPGGQGPYQGPAGGATTTTTTTLPQLDNGPLSCSAAADSGDPSAYVDVSWPTPSGSTPSYYVVYYTASDPGGSPISGWTPHTTSPDVYGTTVELSVGAATTYWFQVEAVYGSQYSAPSSTCTATTSGPADTVSYTSAAQAQALDLQLGGDTASYELTNPPTQATNDGSGSNAPVVAQPTVAVPGADSFFSASAATQIAEANTDGTSYACAGVLSNGGSLGGGSSTSPCTTSGNAGGGVQINLLGLPGVGSAVGSIVGGLTLQFDAATSWATSAAGGSSFSGSASLPNGTVTVTPLGLAPVTLPLGLSSPLSGPTDLVKALTAAMSADPAVSALAAPLQSALSQAVSITGDYQVQNGATFTTTAIHIQLLASAGTGDVAISTVGPNTEATTPAPCTVDSLVVNPSSGPNGTGVALTDSGQLADESSFSLTVNIGSDCSDVTVGYAPSGCTPGASGCPTQFAEVTGSGGTLYGTAGTSSTVWSVGTTTFTVFTGSPPAEYSPLTQQQVILCTEKGDSGQC